jgi:hypothetical protein
VHDLDPLHAGQAEALLDQRRSGRRGQAAAGVDAAVMTATLSHRCDAVGLPRIETGAEVEFHAVVYVNTVVPSGVAVLAGWHEPTRGASGPVLIAGLPGLSARPTTRVLEDEGWVRR